MDILVMLFMQGTVNPVTVTSTAPSRRSVTLGRASASVKPMSLGAAVTSANLEHLAYSLPEDVFPATATLLVPSPSTAMETGSAIASLE